MRDRDRIGITLAAIGEIWDRYPDMRLGQLLLNVARDPQLYYIEDSDLVEALELFYRGV